MKLNFVTAILLIIFSSTEVFSAALFGPQPSGQRSTPRGEIPDGPLGPTRSPYGRILRDLQALRSASPNNIQCDRTLESTARALICNCANEAGVERLGGKVAVQRVVFSRAKSNDFPNSIRGVICQQSQFSWLNGGFDSNCNRRVARRAPYLNSPVVSEPVLSQCYAATVEAARLEFQENPNGFFAMNYASTNPAAYRAYGSSMPRWVRNCISQSAPRVGSHIFCNAAAGYSRSVRPDGGASVIVRLYESILKLFSYEALAAVNETEIINTSSKQKLILDDKIKALIKKKHPNFKIYSFKSFTKPSKELMSGVRDNLPMAVKGDYDGNGTSDVILLGVENEIPIAIAFMFDDKGRVNSLVAHKFEKEDLKNPMDLYLVNIPKTKIKHKVGNTRDAFQAENFGGVAVPMLHNGKSFVRNNPKDGFLFNEQELKK